MRAAAMRVADFTSSLYLGMRHAGADFRAWPALTSGRPAVLDPPAGTAAARRIAMRAGAQRAAFTRSTLHGLSDCLELLAGKGTALAVDSGVYPVGRWAVQRSAGTGVPLSWVGHHDPGRLEDALRRLTFRGRRPVVVADGYCTGCGEAYPLAAVVPLLDAFEATLVLDDTQALGIFGTRKAGCAYGTGGGGSVAYSGVPHAAIVTVSSLAKAFGVPIACVAGPGAIVRRLRTTGSAVHSSPPSHVDIAAARHAVARNDAEGDELRSTLADRVRLLRQHPALAPVSLMGGLFPVQNTPTLSAESGRVLLDRLAANGVRAVLRQTCGGGSAVTLVVTANHPPTDIDRAARVLGGAWKDQRLEVRRAA